MRLIAKPSKQVPNILKTKGVEATKEILTLPRGKLATHEFDSKIYGHREVKDSLKKLQHDKCCFCESKVSHITHGDVEHFRPKGGWTQDDDDTLKKPGYYWLAYDFSNLYLSCQICNQSYKKNYFPIAPGGKRATGPKSSLAAEKALLIDLGKEDPADHITFHEEVAVPVKGSKKGEATIARTGLNRQALASVRHQHLGLLRALVSAAKVGTSAGADAKKAVRDMLQEDAIYSLMARANFPEHSK